MNSEISNHPVIEKLLELVSTHAPSVIWGIALIFLGWLGGKLAKRVVAKTLKRTPLEQSLTEFASSLSFFAIFGFFFLAALSSFGVETTSLVAALGAIGFAIGLSLQRTLSNFAAGLLILTQRPFKVGDFIDGAGISGTVKSIGLFSTELAELDNVEITVPNSKLCDDVIKNYSANKLRRIDLQLGISYEAEITEASSALLSIIKNQELILSKPEPSVSVRELADSAVVLEIRAWTKTENYWPTRYEILEKIKVEMDRKSIEIPYPQAVVHLKESNKAD